LGGGGDVGRGDFSDGLDEHHLDEAGDEQGDKQPHVAVAAHVAHRVNVAAHYCPKKVASNKTKKVRRCRREGERAMDGID